MNSKNKSTKTNQRAVCGSAGPFSDAMSADINGMSVSNARRDAKKSAKTTMLESTRRLLEKFYAPFNDQLAALLGDHAYTWPAEQ